MLFKSLYLLDNQYYISNDGEFMLEKDEVDLNYFLEERTDKEDFNKLIWETHDNSSLVSAGRLNNLKPFKYIYENFSSYFKNINSVTVKKILFLKEKSPVIPKIIAYQRYFVLFQFKNDDNIFALKNDWSIEKLEILQDSNAIFISQNFEKDEFCFLSEITKINVEGHNDTTLILELLNAIKLKLDFNKIDKIYMIQNTIGNNMNLEMDNIITILKTGKCERYFSSRFYCFLKFDSISSKSLIKLPNDRLKYSSKFKEGNATSRFILRLVDSFFQTLNYHREFYYLDELVLNYLLINDPYMIKGNFIEINGFNEYLKSQTLKYKFIYNYITEEYFRYICKKLYRKFLEDNNNDISFVNKYIRHYYFDKASKYDIPSNILVTWLVDYIIKPRIIKGRDVKKRFGITEQTRSQIIFNL